MSRKTLVKMVEDDFTTMKKNLLRCVDKAWFCVNYSRRIVLQQQKLSRHSHPLDRSRLSSSPVRSVGLSATLRVPHVWFPCFDAGRRPRGIPYTEQGENDSSSNFYSNFPFVCWRWRSWRSWWRTASVSGCNRRLMWKINVSHPQTCCDQWYRSYKCIRCIQEDLKGNIWKMPATVIKQSRSTQASDLINATLWCLFPNTKCYTVEPSTRPWNNWRGWWWSRRKVLYAIGLGLPRFKPVETTFIWEYVMVRLTLNVTPDTCDCERKRPVCVVSSWKAYFWTPSHREFSWRQSLSISRSSALPL